jgi:hypothetical protein
MKTKTFSPMGALHPALFFAGVYIVALFFSIFICSAIFYSCNSRATDITKKEEKTQPVATTPSNSNVAVLH